MAVSVRIEDEAFSDDRYAELAEYAGLADADHARGKMMHLWRQCTLEHTYTLSGSTVRRYLGANGVTAIVRARLGIDVGDDRVRIRGTKGRIEWLKKLRENGRKGGRPIGNRKKPSGYSVALASGSPELNPPAPAPAPAPTSVPIPTDPEVVGVPSAPKPDSPGLKALKVKVDRATRKTVMPEGWTPREQDTPANVNAARELAAFRDHHAAKGNAFADWNAAWRTWCRNSIRFASERGQQGQPNAKVGRVEPMKPEDYPSGEIQL